MKYFVLFISIFFSVNFCFAQTPPVETNPAQKTVDKVLKTDKKEDTLSEFAQFNQRAEKLFTVLPVPLYSYSIEAGHTYGLAKFNIFDLYQNDTITKPSKVSGVYTTSTKGRVNFSISNEMVFKDNKYIIISFINYKKTPEYILGIGNDVQRSDVESISNERIKCNAFVLRKMKENLYLGVGIDVADNYNIEVDSNSILKEDNAVGLEGGLDVGAGISAAYDSRDSRYNSFKGAYVLLNTNFYSSKWGSRYDFAKVVLDMRKFVNPWYKHVIAFQATSTYSVQDVPFYDLAMLGGDSQMRGYYKGALRDKVLIDGQVEYRMPIWNIFGFATWVGTGRVAKSYEDLALKDFWLSYGAGLRIKVDSKHNTNLRLDLGFGPEGVRAFYIGFAEAF